LRFIAEGPSIPDDLLLARDQGRVIFFCGAGVSRARANLPDFFGLAEKVITKLGVEPESPAFKLIQEAREIDRRVGVSGVISADRVFGLLERDFLPGDIEEAVAFALKPALDCDLHAHKILLDLATTPDGAVRLVTTNFDRLFDACGRDLKCWQPPRLPDPTRSNEIDGVVYLHGRATPEYSGAEGDGFILSSSEFGRAYLSDGWATTFIREILEKYVVVFVGYTADDPPVQYLLEALRKKAGNPGSAYAFQSGEQDDATSRWRHKGVQAISYSADTSHSSLWFTLEAWAERARNPDAWYSKIIDLAKQGPETLQPHERGQVAHVVSTYEGMKRFSQGDNPPPATWLCVFDSHCRYAKPRRAGSFGEYGPYVDPFDLYSLDTDILPAKFNPEQIHESRETPSEAWNAFSFNRLDLTPLGSEHLSSLTGQGSFQLPRLVKRIEQLGNWIAAVCEQPAAVWWAAHKQSIHSTIQERIQWSLERSERVVDESVRKAWRFLFDSWGQASSEFHRGRYALEERIKAEGWSPSVLRKYGKVYSPYLSVESNVWNGPTPPSADEELSLNELIQVDVKYADHHEGIVVPDEWCYAAVKVLRQNLELAIELESEIGGYGLDQVIHLNKLERDADDNYSRSYGLAATVIHFSELFARLIEIDEVSAKREFFTWPADDSTIFARLRVWGANNTGVVCGSDLKDLISSFPESAFWDGSCQRDLLIMLSSRWGGLSLDVRELIESRLLKGPDRWESEEDSEYELRSAWAILSRLQWLSESGCAFSFDFEDVKSDLLQKNPDWKEEYGSKAADSLEGRGGMVKVETNYDALLKVPLSSLLDHAKELSGRGDDFLVELDPFLGLAANFPVRAFSALTMAAKNGDFQEWAWQKFLDSDARKMDRPKFSCLIANRLCGYSDETLSLLIRPICNWLRNVSSKFAVSFTTSFDKISFRVIAVLEKYPSQARSGIVRGGKQPDWTMEAINSPTGKVVEALFDDPRKNGLGAGECLPKVWLEQIEKLLNLSDDQRRHAYVLVFYNLSWFYHVDPEWAEKHLMCVLDFGDAQDRDAAWAGFLWGAKTPSRELYIRLKKYLLGSAVSSTRNSHMSVLAGMILSGWGSRDERNGGRFVTDEEFRSLLLNSSDEFRSQMLWQVQRWSNENERWKALIPQLLRNWPRQIAAKTPATSARLCELVFSSVDEFPQLVKLVLPLLTKVDSRHLILPELKKENTNLVDRYPAETLAVLHAVLPESAHAWPYGIDATIKLIGEADGALKADAKLIELLRKWDAR
jgi:hypothetical protein